MPPEPQAKSFKSSRQLDVTRLLWELEEAGSLHLKDTDGRTRRPCSEGFAGPADLSEESHSQATAIWRRGMEKGVKLETGKQREGKGERGREGERRESDSRCLLLGHWSISPAAATTQLPIMFSELSLQVLQEKVISSSGLVVKAFRVSRIDSNPRSAFSLRSHFG